MKLGDYITVAVTLLVALLLGSFGLFVLIVFGDWPALILIVAAIALAFGARRYMHDVRWLERMEQI